MSRLAWVSERRREAGVRPVSLAQRLRLDRLNAFVGSAQLLHWAGLVSSLGWL